MAIMRWYDDYDDDYFNNVIKNGVVIHTSGTSGKPKSLYQNQEKIAHDAKKACISQDITPESYIYSCLNPEKAGGLFAQTIPALTVGANVDLVRFNPYDYVREVTNYSHSHLTPKQALGVMKVKGFKKLDLTDHIFMCGSEPVTYDIIEAFIEQGATVMLIWGMSEVGPNAIMHTFNNMDEVYAMKEITPPNSTPLGNEFNIQWKIVDTNLHVRGGSSIYKYQWFNTLDQVIESSGSLFYTGRDGTPVDFERPRKG